MKQIHFFCILIIVASIALSNFSDAFPVSADINFKSENVYIDGSSADQLYQELVKNGASEKFYPELPIPPNLKYGKVKEILWKNIYCSFSQYNSNFSGISSADPQQTIYNCTIKLKE